MHNFEMKESGELFIVMSIKLLVLRNNYRCDCPVCQAAWPRLISLGIVFSGHRYIYSTEQKDVLPELYS